MWKSKWVTYSNSVNMERFLKLKNLRILRRVLLLGSTLLLLIACGSPRQAVRPIRDLPTPRPKVIVLIVDSLTSHALTKASQDAKYPAIHFLMKQGHYFSQVIASFPSMTVSDVSTILTGAYPEEHRIPGLVWIDVQQNKVVNYGNNIRQTLKIGSRSVVRNTLYELNQTHLSKNVRTVFESLQDAGYSTGAINLLVYRGKTPHSLSLPFYARPFSDTSTYHVLAPNTFVFGQLTSNSVGHGKQGIFNRIGLNDDFSTQSLIHLIKSKQLPDFTMVYLPDNDSIVHKYGADEMKGIVQVEKNLQKILNTYGSWDSTLKHATIVLMGDGGVTPILSAKKQPTIFLKDLFPQQVIHRWGRRMGPQDDVGIAVNSRMAYVYLLSSRLSPEQAATLLLNDKRIDVVAWSEGNSVRITNPENKGSFLQFHKGGAFRDPYGVPWDIQGNPGILDIKISPSNVITYGRYPDALHQVWSAMHDQDGNYLIVTAKRGYQFGDESAPVHNGGAQQASLLDEDVIAPVLVTGSDRLPSEPLRFVDLKQYFMSLVQDLPADQKAGPVRQSLTTAGLSRLPKRENQ